MKVNGFALRNAIRNREAERDVAIAALAGTFNGNESLLPEELMEKIERCEKEIAKLQAFQAEYNLTVTVRVGEEEITMAEAVKRIGGIDRVSQQWKNIMKRMSGDYRRASNLQIDSNIILAKAKQIAMEASTLRGKMSMANSTEIDIPELEEYILE